MKNCIFTLMLIFVYNYLFSQEASNIELKIQKGHTNKISCIKTSLDGKLFLTSSYDFSIRLWESKRLREIREFNGHSKAVSSVAFCPTNNIIASGSYDRTVKVWNLSNAKLIKNLDGFKEGVTTVEFSPDGKYLIGAGEKIIVWETHKFKKITELNDDDVFFGMPGIVSFKFIDNAHIVCKYTHTGEIVIWNFLKKKIIKKYFNTKNDKINVRISITENNRLVGNSDYSNKDSFELLVKNRFYSKKDPIIGFSVGIGSGDTKGNGYDTGNETLLVFDNNTIISVDTSIVIINTKTDKIINCLIQKEKDEEYASITFRKQDSCFFASSNKNFIAFKIDNDSVFIWSKVKLGIVTSLEYNNNHNLLLWGNTFGDIHTVVQSSNYFLFSMVKPVDFAHYNSHSNQIYFGYSSDEKSIFNINLQTMRINKTVDLSNYEFNKVTSIFQVDNSNDLLMFSLDDEPGSIGATGERGGVGELIIYNIENKSFISESEIKNGIAVSKLNLFIPSIMTANNRHVNSYNIESKTVKAYKGHSEFITDFDFCKDRFMASTTYYPKNIYVNDLGGQLFIWDLANEKTLKKINNESKNGFYSVKFSNLGKILGVGSYNKILLYDTTNFSLMKEWNAHSMPITDLLFSKKDNLLISGSEDKEIKIWDMKTYENVHTFCSHRDKVNNLQFINDTLFFSTSNDGTIKVFDIKHFKEVISIVTTSLSEQDFRYKGNKNASLIYTPDFYYMNLSKELNSFCFVNNLQSFKADQFDLQYNRPDIILQRLGFADSSTIKLYQLAYKKRLKRMNFTENMFSSDWHVPEISILNKDSIAINSEKEKVNIKISASDSKYLLDRINIWLNNVPIFGTSGINLKQENIKNYFKNIELKLDSGNNKIEVSVLNQKGAESIKDEFYVNYIPKNKYRSNLYIVTLSTAKYKDNRYDLQYSVKDGRDIALQFSKSKKFDKIFVDTLFDENVTQNHVNNLKEKLMRSNIEDEVILFVSGHGILDDSLNFYFAGYDVDFSNPRINGIPYENIENMLDGIPARKKLLLIDACHSGLVDKENTITTTEIKKDMSDGSQGNIKMSGTKGVVLKYFNNEMSLQNSFELMQELFVDLNRGTGAAVISAAAGTGFALESDRWNNGVFTYCLLSGIKEMLADKNKDGEITVSELKEYVLTLVPELTNGRQKPTTRQENLEFDFRVW